MSVWIFFVCLSIYLSLSLSGAMEGLCKDSVLARCMYKPMTIRIPREATLKKKKRKKVP